MKGSVSNPILYNGVLLGCISDPKILFVKWGNILGNIYNQEDLQKEFSLYAPISNLARVAFSGNYNDLLDIPPIVAPNLQQVTDKGNVTTDLIIAAGLQLTDLDSSATTMVTASPDGILGFRSLPSNTPPGGPNNSLQFNSDGEFNGTIDLIWNDSILIITGQAQISSLSSTGTTMVVSSSAGLLGIQPIPQGYTFTGTTSEYTTGAGTYLPFPTNLNQFINGPGYITGVTEVQIVSALGYQPLDPSGNTAQYFRGDGSLAMFPVNLSYFTNDVGFITASSVSTLTNKSGNISQWTNNVGYLTSVTPGGTDTDIQFNQSGTTFAGSSNFTWNYSGQILGILGTLGLGTKTPGSTLDVTVNALGNTLSTSSGLVVSNNTPATSGTTIQYSPIFRQRGNVWDSTNHVSRTLDFYWAVEPVVSGGLAGGSYILYRSDNGSAQPIFEYTITGPSNGTIAFPNGTVTFNTVTSTYYEFGGAGTAMNLSVGTNGNALSLNNFGTPVSFQIAAATGEFLELGAQRISNVFGITAQATGSGTALPISLYTSGNTNQILLLTNGNVSFETGKITTVAATANIASLNLPTGVAPTTPIEGDIWKTGTHLYIYLNGTVTQIV